MSDIVVNKANRIVKLKGIRTSISATALVVLALFSAFS